MSMVVSGKISDNTQYMVCCKTWDDKMGGDRKGMC